MGVFMGLELSLISSLPGIGVLLVRIILDYRLYCHTLEISLRVVQNVPWSFLLIQG